MWKNNISFVIFAYNEEKRIEFPIKNFINYWEVIVIDNFSEDNTKEIAEKYWAKVYQYKNPWYTENQEELDFVRSKLDTDYIVWSYADIMRDKKLLESVISITNKWEYDWIAARTRPYHYGLEKLHITRYNSQIKKWFKLLCVYKKNLLYCSWVLHSNLKNNCKNIHYIADNNSCVNVFQSYNTKKIINAYNIYSDIESRMRFDAWEKVSLFKVFIKIFSFFILYFFIEWWRRSGKAWFIMTLHIISYYFYVCSKQRELENNITLDSIEHNYTKIKLQILNDINSSKSV